MTGLTEAAKARTPLVLVAADTPAGEVARTSTSTRTGWPRPSAPCRCASTGRRAPTPTRCARSAPRSASGAPVLLNLPLDVANAEAEWPQDDSASALPAPPRAVAGRASREVADAIAAAERPVDRRRAAAPCSPARASRSSALSEPIGAPVATSAMGHGLFNGYPFSLGISGGFASPLAAEVIGASDLVLAFGAAADPLDDGATARSIAARRDGRPGRPRRERRSPTAPTSRSSATRATTAATLLAELGGRGHHGRRPPDRRAAGRDRRPPLARRAVRGRLERPLHRPARAQHRPRRPAAGRAHGRRRLRALHGLPGDVPRRPGPRRLRLHPVLPVDRPRPGERDRRRARAPGPAHRRRLGDGGAMMGLPEIETAARLRLPILVRRLRRRRLRRRGPPLPADGPPGRDRPVPRRRLRRDRARRRRRGRSSSARSPTSTRSRRGSSAATGPLLVDAKVDPDVVAEWLEEAFRAA